VIINRQPLKMAQQIDKTIILATTIDQEMNFTGKFNSSVF
jgi:hypothetical protein